MIRKWFAKIAPAFGFLFLLAYIRNACVDVVYTDYIRLVNSYLPDVFSFRPYLQGDILTRIPINYIERVINVVCFRYSTMFDMIMGIIGLSVAAYLIMTWAERKGANFVTVVVLFVVMFSLDKWEMIINGTGWVHFWAFALFFYNFIVYDRLRSGEKKAGDETRLRVLPWVIILLFSGPYCAIYAGALLVIYIIDCIARLSPGLTKKDWIIRFVTLLVPFALYYISRKLSVEEIAGATSEPLMSVLVSDPVYFVKFFVKSFASMIIGGETAVQLGLSGTAMFIMGLVVMAGYVWAVVINFRTGLYKKTALPMLLIVCGLVSHAIVLWSRWVFMDDMYAMSSRYALQFQCGIMGIILSLDFGLKLRKHQTEALPAAKPKSSNTVMKVVATVLIAAFFFGRMLTNNRELDIAKYRKEYFENMRVIALNADEYDDDTIKSVLQYSKPDKTREALRILKENKLNIFR